VPGREVRRDLHIAEVEGFTVADDLHVANRRKAIVRHRELRVVRIRLACAERFGGAGARGNRRAARTLERGDAAHVVVVRM
jgi:hypothetical protein